MALRRLIGVPRFPRVDMFCLLSAFLEEFWSIEDSTMVMLLCRSILVKVTYSLLKFIFLALALINS